MKKNGTATTLFLVVTAFALLQCASAAEQGTSQSSTQNVRSNIIGAVVDAEGKPVANAKVTVLDPDDNEIVARAITNENGEYVIECLDPRTYHLALSGLPQRFVGQTVVVNVGNEGQIVQWSSQAAVPAVATTRVGGGICGCGPTLLRATEDNKRRMTTRSNIVGKVVDSQGNPIKKAKVSVLNPDNKEIVTRRLTDDEGNYFIGCLDHSKYALTISALPQHFSGQNTVVDLGKDGLDVQWATNKNTPTVESAKMGNGVCECAAPLGGGSPAGGAVVAGVGSTAGTIGPTAGIVGAGIVVGTGTSVGVLLSDDDDDNDTDDNPPPASPSR